MLRYSHPKKTKASISSRMENKMPRKPLIDNPTMEEIQAMDRFQEAYVIRMQRQMKRDKREALTQDEIDNIHLDAMTHIGNSMPDWNNWNESRQIAELKKLRDFQLLDALKSTVDGGQPVLFVLPDTVKVELIQNLSVKHPIAVYKLLKMTNKYGEFVFELMSQDSEEKAKLGTLFRNAERVYVMNRTIARQKRRKTGRQRS